MSVNTLNTLRQPTAEYAIELMQYLPQRPDYDTWIKAVSAIGNSFPEPVALNILLSHFRDERTNEHLYKVNRRLKNVSFGSLVYLAKQNGFTPEKTTFTNRLYGAFSGKAYINTVPKKRVTIEKETGIIFRFKDYELEERAGIYESDCNMTRLKAEERILKENPSAEKERAFRIGINDQVLNKNLNPKTKQPHLDHTALTYGFKNYCLPLDEICFHIGKGSALSCCHLKEDQKGKTHRANENFVCSELFAIDIDYGLTLSDCLAMNETRKALLIYTTSSHTDQANRFRILFPFPRLIKDPVIYRTMVETYIAIYKADKQCSDPVRGFYGNNNTVIYVIQTGEILEYKERVLI